MHAPAVEKPVENVLGRPDGEGSLIALIQYRRLTFRAKIDDIIFERTRAPSYPAIRLAGWQPRRWRRTPRRQVTANRPTAGAFCSRA